jgi:hypothetical protein
MFNAVTLDNFISKKDADALIRFAESVETWDQDGMDSFWNNRSLNAINIYEKHDKDIGMYLYELRNRIGIAMASAYGESAVYPDLFQIVRWFPGQEQTPHSDDMTEHDNPDLEWFAHRHYGSVLYLNDNYEGGHTYYPQHNFEVVPKAGTLAMHPGTPDHMHGVTTIEGSVRYTIASFWSRDKEYFDGWTIH